MIYLKKLVAFSINLFIDRWRLLGSSKMETANQQTRPLSRFTNYTFANGDVYKNMHKIRATFISGDHSYPATRRVQLPIIVTGVIMNFVIQLLPKLQLRHHKIVKVWI